jgi:uncharacterized protein
MAEPTSTGALAGLPLVDAHCHLLLAEPGDRWEFEACITEAGRPGADGASMWDTPAGLAIRRWCGPPLGLGPHPSPAAYLERRAELGLDAVTSRLLAAAGLDLLLVDTGLDGPPLGTLDALAAAARAPAREVVRLERVAEDVAGPPGRWR